MLKIFTVDLSVICYIIYAIWMALTSPSLSEHLTTVNSQRIKFWLEES